MLNTSQTREMGLAPVFLQFLCVLSVLGGKVDIHLNGYFWDYDLSEEEIRHILRHGSPSERAWVITRILEYAKWADIWRYLSVADICENFEHLRFRYPQDRELWAYALDRWTRHG